MLKRGMMMGVVVFISTADGNQFYETHKSCLGMASNHITPILKSFRWVLLQGSLLTYQCIYYGDTPPCLKELFTPQTSTRSLCSASAHLLKSTRTKLRTMGDRPFTQLLPIYALPDHLRTPQSLGASVGCK